VGSLLELLAERENAAAEHVEALNAQIKTLAGALVVAEESLSRLRIARETIGEVLAGADVSVEPLAAGTGAVFAAVVAVPGSAFSGLQVPFWQEGADPGELPLAYRDVVEVLEDCGEAMRAAAVSAALGIGTEPRHREGMRSKLRRLAERGWCVSDTDGLFALAPGVSGRSA